MSVAPIDYGGDETESSVTVTDAQYADALDAQRLSRARSLRLVTDHPGNAPIDVAIYPIEQAERSELMGQLALRLLEAALYHPSGKKEVTGIIATAWPWAGHLPTHELGEMVDELAALLQHGPATEERDAAALQLLTEWQHTAEIWADPQLHDRLTRKHEFDGPVVPRPGDEAGSGL